MNFENELRAKLQRMRAGHDRRAVRIAAELDFAQRLQRLRQEPDWTELIADAGRIVTDALENSDTAALPADAVRQAEQQLAPVADVARQYTIHCVGHAHIDMNWQWGYAETVATTLDTFRSVLRLMEQFPDFRFTQSQASVYEIVARYDADLLERIRARIDEGRWEPAVATWVEGDMNLPVGEAIARHLLYARQYMAELFGLPGERLTLCWEPDTFGHAASIPTLLARGGVRRCYLCRGGDFEKPPVFWWTGPDGSRVLTVCEQTWYLDQLGPHITRGLLKFCEKTGAKDWMCVYGVGDHGGGPTRRDLLRAKEMDSWPVFPHVRFATAGEFYDILEARGDNWPVLSGELNFEFPGCYASQSRIKRSNRQAENACLQAESASALAWRTAGAEYPANALRDAWTRTLFGHFHDILPGSCTPEGRDYHLGQFQLIQANTRTCLSAALKALAGRVDTGFAAPTELDDDIWDANATGPGMGAGIGEVSSSTGATGWPRAMVAFNPCAWPRKGAVNIRLWESGFHPRRLNFQDLQFAARMGDGTLVPAQRMSSGKWLAHSYVELAVPVELPAGGWSAMAIEPVGRVGHFTTGYPAEGHTPQTEGFQPGVTVNGRRMENGHIAVELDEFGGVVHLIDRHSGAELAQPEDPLGVLEYVLERPGGMSAWNQYPPRLRKPPQVVSVRQLHGGPHVAAFETKLRFGESAVTVTSTLRAGEPWLEMTVDADWLERGCAEVGIPSLRMRFPTALSDAFGRYETPGGWVKRDLRAGEPVPAVRWAEVVGQLDDGSDAGCVVLNEGVYSHALDGGELSVTLLRASYEPDPLPEMGRHRFRLAVAPRGADTSPAAAVRMGMALNHPLHALPAEPGDGPLPAQAPDMLTVEPGNVVISAVKKCEHESALVLRLQETDGRSVSAKVAFDELWGRPVKAVETDLLERPVQPSAAKPAPGGFTAAMPAFGVMSVKVTFA
ncbi:MAG: alpha-mannosidase [Phycisphaerae bacterium]